MRCDFFRAEVRGDLANHINFSFSISKYLRNRKNNGMTWDDPTRRAGKGPSVEKRRSFGPSPKPPPKLFILKKNDSSAANHWLV
ncbi:unnamed protein product [Caenorhabditis auriculariae]|uniref:Uncharacterized protein n=1 Tax=Caenorhabditis auriculariae TaxID=2777116 RepID=A0A8S1HVX1_9PELO|nr:unnamed protein product [Caenorhabditis auriculariae]